MWIISEQQKKRLSFFQVTHGLESYKRDLKWRNFFKKLSKRVRLLFNKIVKLDYTILL